MAIEYQMIMLPINEQLEAALRKIQEDGWVCVTGTFPMAIYNLQRELVDQNVEQQIEMGIDDSKITILRGNAQRN